MWEKNTGTNKGPSDVDPFVQLPESVIHFRRITYTGNCFPTKEAVNVDMCSLFLKVLS